MPASFASPARLNQELSSRTPQAYYIILCYYIRC